MFELISGNSGFEPRFDAVPVSIARFESGHFEKLVLNPYPIPDPIPTPDITTTKDALYEFRSNYTKDLHWNAPLQSSNMFASLSKLNNALSEYDGVGRNSAEFFGLPTVTPFEAIWGEYHGSSLSVPVVYSRKAKSHTGSLKALGIYGRSDVVRNWKAERYFYLMAAFRDIADNGFYIYSRTVFDDISRGNINGIQLETTRARKYIDTWGSGFEKNKHIILRKSYQKDLKCDHLILSQELPSYLDEELHIRRNEKVGSFTYELRKSMSDDFLQEKKAKSEGWYFLTKELDRYCGWNDNEYLIDNRYLADPENIERFILAYTKYLVLTMNDVERLKHQLLFISRLSVNYHTRAEKTFLGIASIATYLALVLSAGSLAAISNMFPDSSSIKSIGGAFSLVVLTVNGAILAYGVPQKANVHASFRSQWIKLMGVINRIEPTQENYETLKQLEAESYMLHEQEPAVVEKWRLIADKETRVNMGLPPH